MWSARANGDRRATIGHTGRRSADPNTSATHPYLSTTYSYITTTYRYSHPADSHSGATHRNYDPFAHLDARTASTYTHLDPHRPEHLRRRPRDPRV